MIIVVNSQCCSAQETQKGTPVRLLDCTQAAHPSLQTNDKIHVSLSMYIDMIYDISYVYHYYDNVCIYMYAISPYIYVAIVHIYTHVSLSICV